MRVAVTGGSGVVGRALLSQLLAVGHEVRALARTDAAARTVRGLGASPVAGHILDVPAVERLVAGCEVVFHVAGVNEMCSLDPALMWRVNVDGSAVVVEASARAGARRLVHTSSAVTIGEAQGAVANEDTVRSRGYLSEYERSKTAAETLVLSAGGDIEVVSVNPSSVQGPGRATGTGALLLAAARGRVPVLVDATFSIVDIEDCAHGHLLAAENGIPGRRYLLSGAVLTVREAVRIVRRLRAGAGSPWFVDPRALRLAAPVVAVVSRLSGRPAPLCPESARVLIHGHRYDGSRATRELGLRYRPLEETFSRAFDWYRAEALL